MVLGKDDWFALDGEQNRLYRSVNQGATWGQGAVLPAHIIESPLSLGVDDAEALRLLVEAEIYRSTDDGVSWEVPRLLPPTATGLRGMVIALEGDFFALDTATKKIYRSSDEGLTWDDGTPFDPYGEGHASNANTVPEGLAIDARGHLVVADAQVVGSSPGRFWLSADYGKTWASRGGFPPGAQGGGGLVIAFPAAGHTDGAYQWLGPTAAGPRDAASEHARARRVPVFGARRLRGGRGRLRGQSVDAALHACREFALKGEFDERGHQE